MKKTITTKEIAEKYGLSYQTVNHYTRLGLLIVVRREGYRRVYEEKEVRRRIEKIIELKNQRYTLHLIRNQFDKEAKERK